MADTENQECSARTISSLGDITALQWDLCANPESQPYNPFVSHAFLHALEKSGSAIRDTGWLAQHILLENAAGELLGILPCYLKSHSRGEYVFDHGWADAYERVGGRYYPKLQASVPFTPATGPRFLIPDCPDRPNRLRLLAMGTEAICGKLGASSVHVTFLPQEDWAAIGNQQWLRRTDTQFHWHNDSFGSFDDFLAALSSRKRKNIRKERRIVHEAGLTTTHLTGSDIQEHHWDAFFEFYLETGSRKWGVPYLRREFFSLISETMAERILLVMVSRAGRYIAAALNFIGGDALYGRNWGAIEHHDCLHFDTCYYQAMDFAIANKLSRVEAGAQGPHKLARGYLPVLTHSLHYLSDPRLSKAVEDYLEHERNAVAEHGRALSRLSPFRSSHESEEEDGF